VLWCHGDPGGWQFSYRYAIVLLPWLLVLLTEPGGPGLARSEAVLLGASVLVNAWATWLFYWTPFVKP
jgi:hypothetical protein